MRTIHAISVVLALALAGCRHAPVGADEPEVSIEQKGSVRTTLTGCGHASGACLEIRETAKAAYLYAQLAQNAYSANEYVLPDYVVEHRPIVDDRASGYAARTYLVRKPGEPEQVVIAYRGTKFSDWRDWLFGNFPYNRQYEQGLAQLREVRRSLPPGTPVVLTGHSLGGAIATYASLREPETPIYIFNASPRVTRGPAIVNTRVAVSQYGEVLAALRKPFINAGGTYTTINCVEGGPFGRHTQRHLADCLTRIAAWEDPEALASAERNGLGPLRRVLR